MAEDAAEEERFRRLRHAIAGRHRRLSASRRPSSKAARRGCSCRTSARSSRRSSAIYRRFGLNDRQIEILAARRRSATITASRAAATGCSSWALARSRSPSPPRPPRPIRPPSRACSPNMAATALRPPGCARVASPGPPISSPTSVTWRHHHDQAPSSGGGERRRAFTYRRRTLLATPVSAQSIVFDPNNYAQNVLTAARALQQINNQITALQNQAQMLINQARNLASLPYSSLQQLQSIDPAHAAASRAGAAHRLRRPADRSGVPDHLRAALTPANPVKR